MRGVAAVVVTAAVAFAVLALVVNYGPDMYFRAVSWRETKRETRTQ